MLCYGSRMGRHKIKQFDLISELRIATLLWAFLKTFQLAGSILRPLKLINNGFQLIRLRCTWRLDTMPWKLMISSGYLWSIPIFAMDLMCKHCYDIQKRLNCLMTNHKPKISCKIYRINLLQMANLRIWRYLWSACLACSGASIDRIAEENCAHCWPRTTRSWWMHSSLVKKFL